MMTLEIQKTIRTCASITLVFISTILNTNAQNNDPEPKNSVSITANPSFFILGGYSLKGFYHLPKRWSFGISAEANFELPDFARDQFFDNNEDIDVHWDFLIGIEARYRFNDSSIDKGWYALGALGFEGWTVENETGLEDEFDNWYATLGIGYNWYPFKKPNFHVGGSYNLVFILNNTDTRMLGASEYNIRPVVPPSFTPVIYLGWRF